MNLVLPLQLVAGSQKLFRQNHYDQRTDGTDFSLLVKLHKYICHFCSNGVNLHTYLLNLKAKFSWCVELILPPTRCKSVIRTDVLWTPKEVSVEGRSKQVAAAPAR